VTVFAAAGVLIPRAHEILDVKICNNYRLYSPLLRLRIFP